jgi:hypothetical protein
MTAPDAVADRVWRVEISRPAVSPSPRDSAWPRGKPVRGRDGSSDGTAHNGDMDSKLYYISVQ